MPLKRNIQQNRMQHASRVDLLMWVNGYAKKLWREDTSHNLRDLVVLTSGRLQMILLIVMNVG